MGNYRFVFMALLLVIAAAAPVLAGPIFINSVSCGLQTIDHQTFTGAQPVNCFVSGGPGIEDFNHETLNARASVYVSAEGASISVSGLGKDEPSGRIGAGSSASFDSYEMIVPDGPSRPGYAFFNMDLSGSGCNGFYSGSVQFGPYQFGDSWGCSNSHFSSPSPYRAFPITLGEPITIHMKASAQAGSDPWVEGMKFTGNLNLSFTYSLVEADRLTAATFQSVELPEPSLSIGVALALCAGFCVRRRAR